MPDFENIEFHRARGVVQADDPRLSRVFTREELIELLRPPVSAAP